MADKSITLRDFSGGLNTVAEPSTLQPNQSPDLLNVEVTDTKSIRRRKGFLTQAAIDSRPMRALYRFYKRDGAKRWLAVCGTAVYSTTAEALRLEYTQLAQAETLGSQFYNPTTQVFDPLTMYSDTALSGGSAVRLTATSHVFAMAVPYSNSISLGVAGDSVRASIDGGPFITQSNGKIDFVGLTATNHTVVVATVAAPRNNTAAHLTSTGAARYRYLARPMSDVSGIKTYSFRFYDDGTTATTGFMLGSRRAGTGGFFTWEGFGIAPGGTAYQFLRRENGVSTWSWASARSVGWHTVYVISIKATYNGIPGVVLYFGLDDYLHSYYAQYDSQTVASDLAIWVESNSTVVRRAYVDELRTDKMVMVDDFANLNAWTAGGNATTYTQEVQSTRRTTDIFGLVDTVQYSASPAGTKIATVSGTDSPAFVTFGDKAYFSDAGSALRSFDGSTVLALTATPKGPAPPASSLATKQNRIFSAGKATDRSLLEYTVVGDGADWRGGALKSQAQEEWGVCTGLAVWRDALFRFGNTTTHAIQTVGTDDQWVNKTISNRHGCVAPKTLISTPNALMFLSADGVRAYGTIDGLGSDDGSGFMLVSEDIAPTVARITPTALTKACAEFYQGRYYISVPLDGATENTHTLVYRMPDQAAGGSWTLYDYGVSCMARLRGDEDGLFAGTTSGTIVKLETGRTDDGVSIPMRYVIPPIPSPKAGSGFASIKHFARLYIAAKAGAPLALTVTPMGDDAPGIPFTVQVDSTTGLSPIRQPLRARGRSMSLAFDSDGNDQDLTVSEITLTYSERMR